LPLNPDKQGYDTDFRKKVGFTQGGEGVIAFYYKANRNKTVQTVEAYQNCQKRSRARQGKFVAAERVNKEAKGNER